MAGTDDLANGVQLALDATLAQLADEPDRLVALLDGSTPPELAHAVAYLSERWHEALMAAAEGDSGRAADMLRQSISEGRAVDELKRGRLPHDEVDEGA